MPALTSRHQRGRWWMIGSTLAAAAAFMVFFVAASSANLPGSTFEGSDGNLVVNTTGNTDWENVAGLHTGFDLPTGSSDNAFGQGTKEDNANVTVVDGSIPPNKNDLTRFYEASEVRPVSGSDHVFLYLGWERLVNIGNANLDFEINQNATSGFTATTTGPVTLNRTAGDLLVTYDFGGSGTPTLGLLKWLTAANGNTVSQCFSANALPCWGQRVNLSAAGTAEGAVNTGTIAEPIKGGTLTAGLFGEAAIDLTASGLATGCGFSNATTFLKSRSSSSFTAELKDFIAPISTPIAPCPSGLSTTATASVTIGQPISDVAHLTGVTATAVGTITFTAYSDATCSTSVFTSSVSVSGPGDYNSGNFTPTAVGTYYWIASYSGDGTNAGSTTLCGDANESSVVGKAPSSVATVQQLFPQDAATVSAGAGGTPTGTVTFQLFGPGDTTCAGPAVYSESLVALNSGGSASTSNTTFSVVAGTSGTYRWVVTYSGDDTHLASSSACGTEQFTATITNS